MVITSCDLNSFVTEIISGISLRQGPHHVPQKFNNTTFPLVNFEKETVFSPSFHVNSGALPLGAGVTFSTLKTPGDVADSDSIFNENYQVNTSNMQKKHITFDSRHDVPS